MSVPTVSASPEMPQQYIPILPNHNLRNVYVTYVLKHVPKNPAILHVVDLFTL